MMIKNELALCCGNFMMCVMYISAGQFTFLVTCALVLDLGFTPLS